MVEKGAFSWKEFYKNERRVNAGRIAERISYLLKKNDPEVLDVVNGGGVLSFPHTVLDGSLDPVIRISKALCDSNKDKVMAMAVVHYGNHGPTDEFSLDTFLHVFDLVKKELGIEYPSMEALYPPLNNVVFKDDDDRLNHVDEQADIIKDHIDKNTALVMTGDLCHFGNDYTIYEKTEDPDLLISGWIDEVLDSLYHEYNIERFWKLSKKYGNDQRFVGALMRKAIGGDMDYRIFQRKLADYTEILDKEEPHLVASYFYGAWRK